MPLAIQIHNTFRSRWCGAFLQSKGIKVIPSVVWGEADTFWFCFDGIEKGAIVAVSTIGVRNEKELFLAGYKEMMRRLEPSAVICYGKPFEEMDGNVLCVSYEETNHYSKQAFPYDWMPALTYIKGGGAASNGARLPSNDSQIKHIFRKKENHFPDTKENRSRLEHLANDESKYIGTDAKGVRWYVQNLPDGSQLWAAVREGIIQNGGLNPMRRSWDDRTGLNVPRRKGEIENMGSLMKDKCTEDTVEGTLQGKAFMAMFELLDSIYSRKPYKNLAVVLSDISPNTWADGMSADMACWEEICEFYDDLKNTYDSEFELAYQTCLRFLRQYEEEWDYPIPYAMEEFTCEKYREYYFKEA